MSRMSHGGKRSGAGRPKGQGQYGGEATKPVRLPESMVGAVLQFVANKGYRLPFYGSKVRAGFPSLADEHLNGELDLNDYLIKHPAATFFVRVAGYSMLNAGIHENDILIVDRSVKPELGKVVVAAVNGELTVKRLAKNKQGVLCLMPENPDFFPIEIKEAEEVTIWGVVTNVIHAV